MKKAYRYPGTRPFEKNESNLFFGRNEDILNLYQLIMNEQNILLYSKSGLGKSSLINAGIIPKLDNVQNFRYITVRFGNYSEANNIAPLNKVFSKIESLYSNIAENYLNKIIPNENSLWYRMKYVQAKDNVPTTTLFIFDQFEELFSYRDEEIFHFKKQFAFLLSSQLPNHFRNILDRKLALDNSFLTKEELRLLNQPLQIKVLFSIRADRMSLLNKISDFFPNILKIFYELKPLSIAQAREAVIEPAKQINTEFITPVFEYSPQAIDNVINSLIDAKTQTVESFQLQLVCRYAEKLIEDKNVQNLSGSKLSVDDKDLGDIKNILSVHYKSILAPLNETDYKLARVLIEENLIVSGNRVPLPDSVIYTKLKITEELLKYLENSFLLRAELNTVGGRSFEISHDTLIAPILEAYEIRKNEEEQLRQLKQKEEELRLAHEKAEKERIERERERKRQRKIIAIVSVAALISIGLALWGFYQKNQADKALVKAQEQTEIAKQKEEEATENYKKVIEGEVQKKKIIAINLIDLGQKDIAINYLLEAQKLDSTNMEIDSLIQVLRE